ncbi:MAG: S41 family peptidase [Alphaproteobacteria bacterium]|nr:S41 family peptidase [Alphaproteobacteria bacterium]
MKYTVSEIVLGMLLMVGTTVCATEVKPVEAPQVKEENVVKDQYDPYLLMELFGLVYKEIKKEYIDEPEDKKLIESAINGMLTDLDPHSAFMNQDDFNDLEAQTKGEFGGLGMEVTSKNGFVRVVSPIDDTPAFKAGIQAGDYITHIDGESVSGLSLQEAVKKLRGEPGTDVKVKISREKQEPFDLTLTRDIIQQKPVKYEAKGDVGYIRISSFSEKTVENTHEAVKKLTEKIGQEKLKGFVIDVRNNPGGLLDAAIGVVDTFLAQGEIVTTRSRLPEETTRASSKTPDMTNGKPLVVLINEGSASASEIVAGALQDHKRAVIVGLRSFGKGSVQTIKPIRGFGGLKMTIARYYTPSGRSIQAKGIEPDIVVPRAKLEAEPILEGFGERDLHGALAAEEKKHIKKNEKEDKKERENKSDDQGDDKKEDYQLDRAIDILKAIAVYQEK